MTHKSYIIEYFINPSVEKETLSIAKEEIFLVQIQDQGQLYGIDELSDGVTK